MKAYLIHGAYGNPEENWLPWLRRELENVGFSVIAPAFPTPQNQSLEEWNNVFISELATLDQETILVGHSLGCPFILNLLEENTVSVAGCYFVAGFHTLLNHEIDIINKSFVDKTFDWDLIKSRSNIFEVFYGSNDPYIDTSVSESLATHLDADSHRVEGGGHLNEKAGFKEFSLLLDIIKKNHVR